MRVFSFFFCFFFLLLSFTPIPHPHTSCSEAYVAAKMEMSPGGSRPGTRTGERLADEAGWASLRYRVCVYVWHR